LLSAASAANGCIMLLCMFLHFRLLTVGSFDTLYKTTNNRGKEDRRPNLATASS
jgi:hypothetical protein